ncbi:MAG: hypothetical protein ACI4QN_03615 [Candidatus Coproplasma sp.]
MIRYIKCPRCELNYIDGDKQEYCDVCIAEMKGDKLEFVDFDDEELNEELEAEATELCPVCGVNLMRAGEKMCDSCRSKNEYEEEPEVDPEQDEEWKNYLNDDAEDLTLDEAQLDEEFKDDLDDEEDEYDEVFEDEDADDFDDDYDDLDDIEDDEDEDDEDDEDDDLF